MIARNWHLHVAAAMSVSGFAALARAEEAPDEKQACISAAEQGQTQRDDGQYRAARKSLLRCASGSCPRVVVQSCTKWLRDVDESAPTVVLAAKDEHGNDLPEANVTFDGQPFAVELDGKPIVADVGEHVLRFERPGSVPVEQKLLLRAGEKARLVKVTLKPVVSAEPAHDALAQGAANNPPAFSGPPEPLFSARHLTAASLAVGAVASASAAFVLLIRANQHESDAADLREGLSPSACASAPAASCQALSDAVHAQHDDMDVSVALFAGAGALAAGALGALFLWPKAHAAAPATTGWVTPLPGGGALHLSGSFQ